MKYYIEESIYLFGEKLRVMVPSLAMKGLQIIDESYKKLENKYVDILQSIVAKLPWVAKRGRPDIDLYI